MALNSKLYDVLKFIAQVLLPALGTLYFTLAQIWGLQYAEQIVGTIAAIDTFLGIILGISTSSYNKMIANVPEREEDFDDKWEDD